MPQPLLFFVGCGQPEVMGMAAIVQTFPRLIPAKRAAEELGLPYTSLRERVFAGE
jgi:hypothetical protein